MENRYSVAVAWSEADDGFIATVPEFPGLSAFGETREEAVREAQVALELFIEDVQENGESLPEYKTKNLYSGNIRLRIARSLHQQLAEYAEMEGVSMNSLISMLLSKSVSHEETVREIYEHIDARLSEMVASQRAQKNVYISRSVEGDHRFASNFIRLKNPGYYYTACGVKQ